MKRIIIATILAATSLSAVAAGSHQVDGHIRRDGTYVAPHYRTNPNNSRTDNWSSQGNVNPYSGREGTVDPYAPRRNDSDFSSGQQRRQRSGF